MLVYCPSHVISKELMSADLLERVMAIAEIILIYGISHKPCQGTLARESKLYNYVML